MDADNAGSWVPVVVALMLLSFSGWGLWSIPENASSLEANSEQNIPFFVEHFPTGMGDEVPADDVIRIAWHPEESELGTLKTNDRYLGILNSVNYQLLNMVLNPLPHYCIQSFDGHRNRP